MSFRAYHSSFGNITGQSPKLELLIEMDYPFAHEAGVYIEQQNELFITSNHLKDDAGNKHIEISKVNLKNDAKSVTYDKIPCDAIAMGNGGVNYKDGILFCAQGSMSSPSGLYLMSSKPPYDTNLLVSDFHGRPFSSVNDVIIHSDGTIWFTDPTYGYDAGFRPRPRLPSQVYRFDPRDKSIRAVADGFGHPNGLCFSPDEKILYVTDTDWFWGDGTSDDTRVSNIYAFDIVTYSGEPFLTNRRLFAMCDNGIPDGVKCDMNGNVYSGCWDGIHVWSPGGKLKGKILIDGIVANFCFGKEGQMFILNEKRLWRAQLAPSVRGALLRI